MKPALQEIEPARPASLHVMAALVVAILTSILVWAVMSLPREATGLTGHSSAQLSKSGVTNPVTAAVLNYRGYDTLLEIAVLMLALLGTWAVARMEPMVNPPPPSVVLVAFVRMVLPVMVLIAGYLLWIGAFAPGGAFQAGAVVVGAILLWLLADARRHSLPAERWQRPLLALGLTVFTAVAVGVMGDGRMLLEYPPAHAGTLILLIEAAALISIALTLAALYLGGRPAEELAAKNTATGGKEVR